ncbi:MAG: hypothetical protein M1355_00745 [Patescibacteria group bacterium]|nr:hypothetical protein [Patescibacteria group bacterium]MCL5093654.1 hypothetical protein [Patescibacteria group bacterium]
MPNENNDQNLDPNQAPSSSPNIDLSNPAFEAPIQPESSEELSSIKPNPAPDNSYENSQFKEPEIKNAADGISQPTPDQNYFNQSATPDASYNEMQYTRESEEKFNPKLLLIIVGIVFLVLLLGGGTIFLLSRRSATPAETESQATEEKTVETPKEETKEETPAVTPETTTQTPTSVQEVPIEVPTPAVTPDEGSG